MILIKTIPIQIISIILLTATTLLAGDLKPIVLDPTMITTNATHSQKTMFSSLLLTLFRLMARMIITGIQNQMFGAFLNGCHTRSIKLPTTIP